MNYFSCSRYALCFSLTPSLTHVGSHAALFARPPARPSAHLALPCFAEPPPSRLTGPSSVIPAASPSSIPDVPPPPSLAPPVRTAHTRPQTDPGPSSSRSAASAYLLSAAKDAAPGPSISTSTLLALTGPHSSTLHTLFLRQIPHILRTASRKPLTQTAAAVLMNISFCSGLGSFLIPPSRQAQPFAIGYLDFIAYPRAPSRGARLHRRTSHQASIIDFSC